MKRFRYKRILTIFLPVTVIGFLIMAITLTFGTSDAGKAMGVLEGCIVFLIALWLLFIREINGFSKKHLRPFFKRTFQKKRPDVALAANLPAGEKTGESDSGSTPKDQGET